MAVLVTGSSPTTRLGYPVGGENLRARAAAILQERSINLALLWAIRAGVVLLFFTPLVVTTSTVFPFIVGKAVWSRSLIEIIAGLWVVLAIRSPEFRPTRSRVVLLLGLHLAAVFVSGAFGSSFNLSFWSSYERMGGIFDLAHWTVLAAVLVFTVRGLREWKVLITIHLVISVGAVFLALAERFDYQVVSYLQNDNRVVGAAGNASFLAGHMMVNAFLAAALLADTVRSPAILRRPGWAALSVFYLSTAMVSVWVLSETGTRGSTAGLIAGIAVAIGLRFVFMGRGRARLTALVVGAAVPVVVIGLFLARDTAFVGDLSSRSPVVERVVSLSLDDNSLALRATGLRIAGEAFLARPVTGWGGENFEVPYQRYQREDEIPPDAHILDRAHNKSLDLLATTGLLGFVTYLSVWIWLGVLAWRHVRNDPQHRLFHSVLAGALVGLFIHNLFLFDTAVTLMLFAFLAIWAAAGERRSLNDPPGAFRWPTLSLGARTALRAGVPVAVAVVVVIGLYGVNWRVYKSAQAITHTAANVQEVAANLDQFSPLATFGRERLLNIMAGRWETLDRFERIKMIPLLEREGELALRAEPDNMELRFAVARFYRVASVDLPELLAVAGEHTERGAELGPHTASTARALAQQAEAETAILPGGPS